MMTGSQIRKERLDRGWTQAELAARAGCSQPVISDMERGLRRHSTRMMTRIQDALRDRVETSERPAGEFRLPALTVEPAGSALPVSVSEWHRPRYSGDFAICLPLPERGLLFGAVDISGNGPSVLPLALYVQGWLRAWASAQAKLPRLESLISDLSGELRQTEIDATAFFGLVTASGNDLHEIYYQGICCGFPAPLLLVGDSGKTEESCVEWPSLPIVEGGGRPPETMPIAAPWRLVVATDGLLERLGAGDQQAGLRWLRRWQKGSKCDICPAEVLPPGPAPAVDELLTVASWVGWDIEVPVNALDYDERTRIRREIVARIKDRPDAVKMYNQALLEAMHNVAKHAYPDGNGRINVRFRVEAQGYRTEIEDKGRNKMGRKEIARSDGGFEVMRRGTDHLSVRHGASSGTVVTLVLNALAKRK